MKEFQAVFQISKTVIFEVEYYTISTNAQPHFATSAAEFCRNKRDFRTGGQAQSLLLPRLSSARKFYEKWDCHHLHNLTPAQCAELSQDLETLKEQYNYIVKELDETQKPYNPRIPFWKLVEFSKQEPKKRSRKERK